MTSLELVKAVVERSKLNPVYSNVPLSRNEADAIGRLVAWAECVAAYDRYKLDNDFHWGQLVAILEPYGYDDDTMEVDEFVRGLRLT